MKIDQKEIDGQLFRLTIHSAVNITGTANHATKASPAIVPNLNYFIVQIDSYFMVRYPSLQRVLYISAYYKKNPIFSTFLSVIPDVSL